MTDWLGDRLLLDDNTDGPGFELLRLKPEFARDEGFVAALRRRIGQLARLKSRYFPAVRGVQPLGDADNNLAVVFEHAPNVRFSAIGAGPSGRRISPRAVLTIAHQLTEAMAALHRVAPDVSHGILEPHRVAVTAEGHVTILDHVFGSAASAGPEDQRQDLAQIGRMLLSWLVGVDATRETDPAVISRMLDLVPMTLNGSMQPADGEKFVMWLGRALQLDEGDSFSSAVEALSAFGDLAPALPPSHALGELAAPRAGAAQRAGRFQTPPPSARVWIERELRNAEDRFARCEDAFADYPSENPRTAPKPARVQVHRPMFQSVSPTQTPRPVSTADGRRRRRAPLWVTASLGLVAAVEAAVIAVPVLRPVVTAPRAAVSPAVSHGQLHIVTRQDGAQVTVDGEGRGVSPVEIRDVAAGSHTVVVRSGSQVVERTVTVRPRETTAVFIE